MSRQRQLVSEPVAVGLVSLGVEACPVLTEKELGMLAFVVGSWSGPPAKRTLPDLGDDSARWGPLSLHRAVFVASFCLSLGSLIMHFGLWVAVGEVAVGEVVVVGGG